MDSATSKKFAEEQRQAEIRRQIAALQAQLAPGDASQVPPVEVPSSPQRKRPSSGVLVPDTPSKKKRREESSTTQQPRSSAKPHAASRPAPPTFPLKRPKDTPNPQQAQQSTVLQKLAQAHNHKRESAVSETVVRSTAFSAAPPLTAGPSNSSDGANVRDDDLALVEDLSLGPTDHKPPFDDPHFEKLEPNSGIRLLSRSIPHEDFQDYLRGRYYLSPSKLYSVVRLQPNKQGYDVPVCGDWLTVAVVAERGKMKYTQAPAAVSRDDKAPKGDDEDRMDALPELDPSAPTKAGPSRPFQKRQKPTDEGAKPGGKKYINLRLIDFGCRSRGGSADGGKSKIRGDAFLSLLLFESDTCDIVTKEDGSKEKVYRGGSRGAFEHLSRLREGAVIALLNPKILKPFQRAADKPHPTENILALTPESDASIAVIGYAQDLGKCKAMKRDGTTCTSWCDKRVSDVCDYHIQTAIEHRRAARPEFAVGTGGMSSSAKKKAAYDPSRQWGLKPEGSSSGNGATYVIGGHVVSGSSADPRTMYIGENVGREAQAKAARKVASIESDKMLRQLLSRDKEGTRALASAREFSKRQAEKEESKGRSASAKVKGKQKNDGKGKKRVDEDNADSSEEGKPRKNAYSAELIRQLGFDPTGKDGRPAKDANVQTKLDALAALQTSRKIELGRRPGKKSSCVHRPESSVADQDRVGVDGGLPLPFSDSDDELEREEVEAFGRPVGLLETPAMVDLDSDD